MLNTVSHPVLPDATAQIIMALEEERRAAAEVAARRAEAEAADELRDDAATGDEVVTFNHYEPTSFPAAVVEFLSDPEHTPIADSRPPSQNLTWTCSTCTVMDQTGLACSVCGARNKVTVDSLLPPPIPTAPPPPEVLVATPFSSSKHPTPSSHSFPSCESTLMSSVSSPATPISAFHGLLPTTSLTLKNVPSLTPLQIEGVTLALNSFRTVSTTRRGFFLGDSAGIGKGRQIAATIYANFLRGHGRHIWLSVSRSLIEDARRDFADIGAHGIPVHDGMELLDSLQKKGLGSGGQYNHGVIFLTYQLLISASGNRFEQLKQWLTGKDGKDGFNGCIIFDECHKAKNIAADTKTSKYVVEIQRDLPLARVLYASATGVSDIEHMFYAERLGLWGPGTSYDDFEKFKGTISERGVGGLEMLSLEMKMMGVFIARTLSWVGADFETVTVPLNSEDEDMYNAAAEWWSNLAGQLKEAEKQLCGNVPKNMMRNFWSASQRFFREMAVTFKVNYIVESAKADVEEGNSVVIGLQTTGEAATLQYLDDARLDAVAGSNRDPSSIPLTDINLKSLISTAYGIARGFVRHHFPTEAVIEIPDEPPMPNTGGGMGASEYEMEIYHSLVRRRNLAIAAANRGELPSLLEMREKIIASLNALKMPANAIDDMIDRFGGHENVAEMTGRTGRIIRQAAKATSDDADAFNFKYAYRGGQKKSQTKGLSSHVGEVELDQLNIAERQRFQDGLKKIAIISDAASTGISLHANVASGSSERRRIHYTIELPWAADKAIQQLGRTHRSGQVTAPHYKLVVTNLGGENRFAAAVSKRMANLGAITKCDRRAATGSDMGEFNVDSKHGQQALSRMFDVLVKSNGSNGNLTLPSLRSASVLDEFTRDYNYTVHSEALGSSGDMDDDMIEMLRYNAFDVARQALDKIGLGEEGSDRKKANVKFFLNRIAGLPVGTQNLVFKLFSSTLDDIIIAAKKNGWYEGCVEDLISNSVTEEFSDVIASNDAAHSAKTYFSCFVLDRGWELKALIKNELEEYEGDGSGMGAEEQKDDDEAEMADFIVNDDGGDDDDDVTAGDDGDNGCDIGSDNGSVDGNDGDRGPVKDGNNGAGIIDGGIDDSDYEKNENHGIINKIASTGFYVSKRKMNGGDFAVIYVRRKFPFLYQEGATGGFHTDPLGVMVVFRPNTGRTGQELGTEELLSKYILVKKLSDVTVDWNGEGSPEEDFFVKRWNHLFTTCDSFHMVGNSAPRKSKVGIVHGSVMSAFPALAKTVKNAALKKDRTLKAVRVEVEGKKIIGIQFPVDKRQELVKELDDLAIVRSAKKTKGIYEEGFEIVSDVALTKVGLRPKTMLSFFSKKESLVGDKVPQSIHRKGGTEGGNSIFKSNNFSSSKFATSVKKRVNGGGGNGGAKPVKQPKLAFKAVAAKKTTAEVKETNVKENDSDSDYNSDID